MTVIKLGYAPTRRSIFSAPDALKYRGLVANRLKELGIDFVDITDINEEGLLYDDRDLPKVIEKFRREKVDGLFLPHCNFGTEYECARLAKALNVPVLLWGPLDERPEPDGTRLRDTQCGLFATGKVTLKMFGVTLYFSVPMVMLITILIGALIGVANGLIITKFNVAPFIATLGMMYVARGFANIHSKGATYSNLKGHPALGNEGWSFFLAPACCACLWG